MEIRDQCNRKQILSPFVSIIILLLPVIFCLTYGKSKEKGQEANTRLSLSYENNIVSTKHQNSDFNCSLHTNSLFSSSRNNSIHDHSKQNPNHLPNPCLGATMSYSVMNTFYQKKFEILKVLRQTHNQIEMQTHICN